MTIDCPEDLKARQDALKSGNDQEATRRKGLERRLALAAGLYRAYHVPELPLARVREQLAARRRAVERDIRAESRSLRVLRIKRRILDALYRLIGRNDR